MIRPKSIRARREAQAQRAAPPPPKPLTDLGRLDPVLGPQVERSFQSSAPGSAGRAAAAVVERKGELAEIRRVAELMRANSNGILDDVISYLGEMD